MIHTRLALERLRHDVFHGEAKDRAFDRLLYSTPIRAKSARFWTPVEVAYRAARIFEDHGVKRVLDVGSGVGKFCVVAACVCPGIEFIGIEQRPHLVAEARTASARLDVKNAQFHVGDATTPDWQSFDALYLYNPFAENLYVDNNPVDRTVELSRERQAADIRRMLEALVAAPIGRCLLTYNGFGGPIPATFGLAHEERAGVDWLRLWVKRRPTNEINAYYREGEDAVTLVGSAAEAYYTDTV